MKRALLLILAPALMAALSIAQTPPTSSNTDQANVKGCLGGSDGNYTILEDNTGYTFKIGSSSVDLKPHLGHDVGLIGQRTRGTSSAPAAASDDSLAVTDLKLISDHCAAAAATVPTGAVSTPPAEPASTPGGEPAPPATTVSTSVEPTVTPAAATAPAVETAGTPVATITLPAVTAPPAETPVTPVAPAPALTAIVSTPQETASAPTARPRSRSETPAAATTTPALIHSSSAEPVTTPATTDTTSATTAISSEPASTPAEVATKPTAPSKGWSLWLLLAFGSLVVVIGIMFPFFNRWRKQKSLEQAGSPNLSFTHEASSEKGQSDQAKSDLVPRKVA